MLRGLSELEGLSAFADYPLVLLGYDEMWGIIGDAMGVGLGRR